MSMANSDQAEHWNSSEQAARWVDHQELHDRMLAPLGDIVLDAAALSPGDDVLDVGCGCGSTTLAAARAVAPGTAVGLDLSAPMLRRARENAAAQGLASVSFELGDAQVHSVGRAFDVVISRFGVMFFADPVAAFANVRAATRPGGRLAFVCWQPLAANEWLTVPVAAFAEHMPLPEPADQQAPGMFALAEPGRARHVLGEAGWREVTVTEWRVPILLGGGALDDAVDFVRTGSLGRAILDGADAATRDRALSSVRAALARHAGPDGVRLGAAVWLVQARS
jgi:SAM-dependent methyltransferase